MKFIHAANLRLGRAPELPEFRGVSRAEDLEEDLGKLLDAAQNLQVDALFLTGNLFDHQPSEAELLRLDSMFSALSARVFIVPGELATVDNAQAVRNFRWKSGARVFTGNAVDRVYIVRWETEITAVGYNRKYYHLVSSGQISPGERDAMRILLLPFIGEGYQKPLKAEDPGRLPYDYTGIGQYGYVEGSAEYPLYSPGCFEPDSFSSQMFHGFLLGELTRSTDGSPRLSVRLIRNAKREFRVLRFRPAWGLSFTEIRNQMSEAVQSLGNENIYRVLLEGDIPPALFYRKEELKALGYITEIADSTTEQQLFEILKARGAEDLIGRLILQYLESDGGLSEKAFRYALDALLKAYRIRGN